MSKVNIKDITVPEGRRPVDFEKVAEIAASIKLVGLLSPIGVYQTSRERLAGTTITLLWGKHRLEACRSLGWKKIEVIALSEIEPGDRTGGDDFGDLNGSALKMIEIAENLHRAELTAPQRNEHLAQWVKLLEKQGTISDTVSDIAGKPGRKPSAAIAKVAKVSGLSTKTVKRAVAASKVSPAVKAAADAAELSAKARLAISRISDEDQQLEAVEKFAPPDKRPPTEPIRYDEVCANRAQLDQLLVMVRAFQALEKLGTPEQVAVAVKRLDIDAEKTIRHLSRMEEFTSEVTSACGDVINRAARRSSDVLN